MRSLAAALDGRELRLDLTLTVLGVPVQVTGTVQILDVRVRP